MPSGSVSSGKKCRMATNSNATGRLKSSVAAACSMTRSGLRMSSCT
jgi:hypothetical protein